MNSVNNKVLVLGNYRQTLTVIRSLGRAGYYVIAGRDGKRSFTDYSRYTTEVWQHPNVKDEELSFVAALNDFLANNDVAPLIFPVGDTQISCIARNFGQLPTSVAVVMPDPMTAMNCQDKSHVYKLNEGLGIPQPEFRTVCSYSELRSIVERIGYPCVIKPNNPLIPFLGEKAIIVNSATELAVFMPSWPEGHEQLIVQQFAQGDRHTCHFVALRGDILSYSEYKILRTDRRNDTGYMVEGISVKPTPELEKHAQALAQKLKYSGVGSVQFLVGELKGSMNFLEINPRLGGSCALPFFCGYDLPKMAVEVTEYLIGTRVERPEDTSDYLIGKHYVWLMGDLHAIFRDAREGKLDLASAAARLRTMTMTFLRGDFHATWWWKDPLPAFVIYGLQLKSLFR